MRQPLSFWRNFSSCLVMTLIIAVTLGIKSDAKSAKEDHTKPATPAMSTRNTTQLENFGGLQIAIGSEHAPLTIVMYYSLSCSHCHDFQKNDLPEIQKEFIDKGLVRFIYRDFPTDYVFALKAAKIAWCHGKGQYINFSRKLLENQDKWLPKYPDRSAFKTDAEFEAAVKKEDAQAQHTLYELAREMGVSDADYHKCTAPDTDTEKTILHASFEAQKNHQILAAPGFLVNGKVLDGLLNAETIRALLLEMGIHG